MSRILVHFAPCRKKNTWIVKPFLSFWFLSPLVERQIHELWSPSSHSSFSSLKKSGKVYPSIKPTGWTYTYRNITVSVCKYTVILTMDELIRYIHWIPFLREHTQTSFHIFSFIFSFDENSLFCVWLSGFYPPWWSDH